MFVDVTVSAAALGFAALPPDARVEFERTAGVGGTADPSVIVAGEADEAAAATLRDGAHVERLTRLGESEGQTVYRLAWASTPSLVAQLRAADCTVLSVVWRDDTLSIELRFPDDGAASRFYAGYDDTDSPLTVRSTSAFGVAGQSQRGALTPKQTTTLAHALEQGYFDVPRRTTLDGLAADLGVSDTAISQRLRRGIGNVLRTTVHVPRVPQQLPGD